MDTSRALQKLGLGTVQFGMDYGVANKGGRVSGSRLDEVIALAQHLRIRVLDTAAAYGESEAALGRYLRDFSGVRVVTKTPPAPDVTSLRATFDRSLARLGVDSVYGLLVHHAADLLGPDGERLWQALESFKAQGRVTRIGVSVYSPEELRAVRARFQLDLVQLPMNLLDQRFRRCGLLNELHDERVEVHVRSVFLQGVLLMEPSELPEYFAPLRATLESIREHADASHTSVLAMALNSVLHLPQVDCVLVGVDSAKQLQHIADAIQAEWVVDESLAGEWATEDLRWLNPVQWKLR